MNEEKKKWKEEFIKSWLELYRYHEVYPWVEGKDIAEQFYLQGRKDEQKMRQERADKAEKRLESERISVNELAMTNQKLEKQVRELEATLASNKANPSIGKLEVESNFVEDQ